VAYAKNCDAMSLRRVFAGVQAVPGAPNALVVLPQARSVWNQPCRPGSVVLTYIPT